MIGQLNRFSHFLYHSIPPVQQVVMKSVTKMAEGLDKTILKGEETFHKIDPILQQTLYACESDT